MLCATSSSQKSSNYCEQNNKFEKSMVNPPTEQTRITPGLELVASSRPDSIYNLAIGNNKSDFSHSIVMKIGTAPLYAKKTLFFNRIQQMALQTQQHTWDLIAQFCPLSTYEEGGGGV
jgi:hypothetical protein